MKRQLLALTGIAVLALPAHAQTTLIGGTVNNGDLEAGTTDPFLPPGGSASTDVNHSAAGSQSLKVDLTVNNIQGQWKALALNGDVDVVDGLEFDVTPGQVAKSEVWVYVPAATTFGQGNQANGNEQPNQINMGVEAYSPATDTWAGLPNQSIEFVNLDEAAKDTWVKASVVSQGVPAGVTKIRTRTWNIATAANVNGKQAYDELDDPLPDPAPEKATSDDWIAAGYSGSIYVDDFQLTIENGTAAPEGTAILGDFNNGDLEAAELGVFGNATSVTADKYQSINSDAAFVRNGTQSLSFDLGAPKANQWKGITPNSNVPLEVVAGQEVTISTWVYVPDTTVMPDTALLVMNFSANPNYADIQGTRFDLTLAAKNTWHEVIATRVVAEGETTYRTDKWYVATVDDPDVAGYSGSIYFDDFEFTVKEGPQPPPDGVAILGEFGNGDMEADALGSFGGESYRAKNTDAAFNHTADGSQSLIMDLNSAKGNRWKGVSNNVDLSVREGETVTQAAWVYIPAATVIPDGKAAELVFNFAVNTNNYADTAGTRFNLATAPRDEWIYVSSSRAVQEGEDNYRSNKWYVQTNENVDGDDWEAFSGVFYIDDVEFTSFPPPALDTIIGGTVNNGDLEAGALNPFTINGGTPSSLQNHTEGGSQSLNVDLTANNSNGQWKGLLPGGVQGAVANDQSTVNITAWVYIPAATTFGTEPYANLNLELRVDPGNLSVAGAPSLNLATADRDVWVKVEALGIPFVGFDDLPITGVSGISLNNWNLETVDMVGAAGDIPANEATPADWEAAGYSGSFFIDDVVVEVINPQGDDIQITDTRFVEEGFQITFISRIGPVDVWVNEEGTLNLGDFEPIDFSIDPADGPYIDFEASPENGQGFYLLVPEGEDP